MREGARVQAVIELLDLINASLQSSGAAADQIIQSFFRSRRYAGSKDRRAIREHVYGLLRDLGRLRFLADAVGLPGDGRSLALLDLALADPGGYSEAVRQICADPHAPDPLDDDEHEQIRKALARSDDVPTGAQLNVSERILAFAEDRFSIHAERALRALNQRAPSVLWAPAAEDDRRKVMATLAKEGITAARGAWSPYALSLRDTQTALSPAVINSLAPHAHLQDESSQLAAFFTCTGKGAKILDLCAGAGGKTLAIARQLNRGTIVAADVSASRLKTLQERVSAAKLSSAVEIFTETLSPDLDAPPPHGWASEFDGVLVDAPCTGSGTWRRNPEARWRYFDQDIVRFQALQLSLCEKAVGFLRPGGRLVFATCSWFAEETVQVVSKLSAKSSCLGAASMNSAQAKLWRALRAQQNVVDTQDLENALQMMPHSHGTDGFFIAIFEKTVAA
ncbi:MAG: RsmB/NOP family class I SAM-dependent RNA methyltransferase [Pseudomonadota bacterium]